MSLVISSPQDSVQNRKNSVLFQWDTSLTNQYAYEFQYKLSTSDTWNTLGKKNGTQHSAFIDLSSLMDGVLYHYRIVVYYNTDDSVGSLYRGYEISQAYSIILHTNRIGTLKIKVNEVRTEEIPLYNESDKEAPRFKIQVGTPHEVTYTYSYTTAVYNYISGYESIPYILYSYNQIIPIYSGGAIAYYYYSHQNVYGYRSYAVYEPKTEYAYNIVNYNYRTPDKLSISNFNINHEADDFVSDFKIKIKDNEDAKRLLHDYGAFYYTNIVPDGYREDRYSYLYFIPEKWDYAYNLTYPYYEHKSYNYVSGYYYYKSGSHTEYYVSGTNTTYEQHSATYEYIYTYYVRVDHYIGGVIAYTDYAARGGKGTATRYWYTSYTYNTYGSKQVDDYSKGTFYSYNWLLYMYYQYYYNVYQDHYSYGYTYSNYTYAPNT